MGFAIVRRCRFGLGLGKTWAPLTQPTFEKSPNMAGYIARFGGFFVGSALF
jgi:hypothetical protein